LRGTSVYGFPELTDSLGDGFIVVDGHGLLPLRAACACLLHLFLRCYSGYSPIFAFTISIEFNVSLHPKSSQWN
jgi:hypothetical protein